MRSIDSPEALGTEPFWEDVLNEVKNGSPYLILKGFGLGALLGSRRMK